MYDKNASILILGAGVSSLSTGILLLKKGYHVHIWAKDLPPNTTSNIAAAFWYPYLCSHKDKAIKWSGFTLRYLKENVLNNPESGCVMRTVSEFFNEKVDDPWWRDAVENFKRLTLDELPQGYVDGYQVETILMDTTKYISWLLDQYKQLGGSLEQKEVKDINTIHTGYGIIINCTGLGSRELFKDKKVYPVRGQIVKVKAKWVGQIIVAGQGLNRMAAIIPRLNDIVLGGTIQPNDWNLNADPKDTEDILQRVKRLSSAFNEIEITEVSVGLRPARDEVRLEVESLNNNYVIHNYGHGGAGYTLSWGCAEDVVQLVERVKNVNQGMEANSGALGY